MEDVKQEIETILKESKTSEESVPRIMRVIEQVAQGYFARGVAAQSRLIRLRLGVEVPSDHN